MSRSGIDPASAFGVADADFDDPFGILEACHERIARQLAVLDRLPAHLAARGVDDEARTAIARIRRYFDVAGPDHHADEETDLFPAVREAARDDAALLAEVDRLERDHVGMVAAWAALRANLDALCDGRAALDVPLASRFAALYRDHVEREERVVYGGAKPLLGAPLRARLARAMVARRRRDDPT
ncbi:MAG TPA: hemerythrin domain-containing protein [Burkholderiaceae bacterium]|nr:hemerythrin domain-containing protein [Burkholderiaceae bacterium]